MSILRVAVLLLLSALPIHAHAEELSLPRSLQRGMSGSDVRSLQEYLLRIPSIFADGEATGFFGPATEKAVQKLQREKGLVFSGTPGTTGFGKVGPRTLAKINDIIATLERARNSAPSGAAGSIASPLTQVASSAPPAATSTQALATTTIVKTIATSSVATADMTPPMRSNGRPNTTLVATTTWVTVSFSTDEPSNCYWSNTPNTLFDHMTNAFKVTGGTMHSSVLWIAQPGDYSFFVRCRDRALNNNRSDYPILFSISYQVTGIDRYVPHVFMSYPTEGDVVAESRVSLAAAASDNTGVAQVRFFLNDRDLNAEDTSPPFSITVVLKPGSYRAFAVARDLDGNFSTSTPVAFTVTAKSAASTGRTIHSNLASAIEAVLHTLAKLFRF